jgi:hypothetical protein
MSPRFKQFIIPAVLGAVLLSACAEASWVASVNDVPIEGDTVLSLRESYQVDESSVIGDVFREDLTGLIYLEAQVQAAEEDFGITGLEDAAKRDAALAEIAFLDRATVEQVDSDPDLTQASVEFLGTQLVVRDAVLGALTTQEPGLLEDLWTNRPEQLAQVCVRILSAATEEEIVAIAARLAAGEDFSAVADEVSPDPENPGGRLECPLPAAVFASPFDQLALTTPVGEISEPFPSEFGWHLMLVDAVDQPQSLEELESDPMRFVFGGALQSLWTVWVDDAVDRADIDVRSQVGTWVPEVDQIAPPP